MRPPGAFNDDGAGSAMHGEAPPPARSNELNSGPSSSQVARRRVGAALGLTAEKSGARKGLASCRETTACGTTRRSGVAGAVSAGGSGGATSRAAASNPASCSRFRMSARAASDSTASSPSRSSNDVSRVAICARISAIPSRRLSMADRRASLLISARTRARSSRARTATTWNFVRSEGSTRPRCAAASTSDAVRASTGMMPSSSRARPRRCDERAVG